MRRLRRGASLLPYTLVIGMVAVVAIGSISLLGNQVNCTTQKGAQSISTAAGSADHQSIACGGQVSFGAAEGAGADAPLSFTPVTEAPRSQPVTSNAVTLRGFAGPVTVTVSGPASVQLVRNGQPTGVASLTFNGGDQLAIRLDAPAGWSQTATANVVAGGKTAAFQVSTRSQVTTPSPVSFASLADREPDTAYTSETVTLSDFDGPVTAAVTGAGNPGVIVNGGAPVASADVWPGQTLALRLTTGSTYQAANSVSLALGTNPPVAWSVTTRYRDLIPDSFVFADQTGVEPAAVIMHAPVALTGFEGPIAASVGGDPSAGLRVSSDNGVSWSGWATTHQVNAGALAQIRVTSGAFSTVIDANLTVGGANAVPWHVSARAKNDTPTAFTLTAASNAEPGAFPTVSTTPTGFDGPITVNLTGEPTAQLRINGGAWAASGSLNPGDLLEIRLAAGAFGESRTVNVVAGTLTPVSWTVTSRAADTVPDAFAFTSQPHSAPGVYVSSSVTVSGFDNSLPVSVSGDPSAQISVNGGAWTTSSTIAAGQTLAVRLLNASDTTTTTQKTATVSLNGTTAGFSASNFNYSWSAWSDYGACSASCGGGTQTRTRTCQQSTASGSTTAANANCSGVASEGISCNTQACQTVNTVVVNVSGSTFTTTQPQAGYCFNVPATGRYVVSASISTCNPRGNAGFGFSNITFGGGGGISASKTNAPPYDYGACWDAVSATSGQFYLNPGQACMSGTFAANGTNCTDAGRCGWSLSATYVGP